MSRTIPPMHCTGEAYAKAVLHCFKYPTQPVLGLLLGKQIQGESKEESGVLILDSVPLFHTGVIRPPHPMLEVALMQISALCKTKSLTIAGVYAANERVEDNHISDVTKKVVQYILEGQGFAGTNPRGTSSDAGREIVSGGSESPFEFFVWQFQNDQIRQSIAQNTTGAIKAYTLRGICSLGSVRNAASGLDSPEAAQRLECKNIVFAKRNVMTYATEIQSPEEVLGALKDCVESFSFNSLIDFEDHLESCQKSYLNETFSLGASSSNSPAEKK